MTRVANGPIEIGHYVSVPLRISQLNKLDLCQNFNCISQILDFLPRDDKLLAKKLCQGLSSHLPGTCIEIEKVSWMIFIDLIRW